MSVFVEITRFNFVQYLYLLFKINNLSGVAEARAGLGTFPFPGFKNFYMDEWSGSPTYFVVLVSPMANFVILCDGLGNGKSCGKINKVLELHFNFRYLCTLQDQQSFEFGSNLKWNTYYIFCKLYLQFTYSVGLGERNQILDVVFQI